MLQTTHQTFTSLALIDPLLAALEGHLLQLLVLARFLRITLRTAQLPVLGPAPPGTVARRFGTRYDAFRTGTQAARLISGPDLALIGNLVVLEHAAELAHAARHFSRLQRVQRRFHRSLVAAFALEVAVGVDTRGRRMAAVSLVLALVDVDAVIISHLVAGLALAVVPKIDLTLA